jgi:hypothetical protein
MDFTRCSGCVADCLQVGNNLLPSRVVLTNCSIRLAFNVIFDLVRPHVSPRRGYVTMFANFLEQC